MLYVPLFFYIFDRLAERKKGEPHAPASTSKSAPASATAAAKASAPAPAANELQP
jgi:hypothetical protein